MKMIYTIAAMLLAANVAVAADSKGDISEFHQHAIMGQLEVTPHLMYDMNTSNAGGGATDVDTTGFRLGSEVEYGVSERMSVGADLTYRSWTVENSPDTKESGLEDVVLFARGSSAMGMGRLAYGLNLGYSLGDAELKANGDETAQTGGMSLRPYVGYEMMAGPGTLGGQLNYAWLGERTGKISGTEVKAEGGGGLGLAAFYEFGMTESADLGVAITYNMVEDTDVTGIGSLQDKNTVLGLRLYAPITVGTNMTVIPRFNYSTTDYDTGGAEDSAMALGADLRMLF